MQFSYSILMLIFQAGSTDEMGTHDLLVDRFATCITAKNECDHRIKVLEELTGKGVDEKLQSFRIVKNIFF